MIKSMLVFLIKAGWLGGCFWLGYEIWGGIPSSFAHQSHADSLVPVRLQLKWKHQFQFAGYYAAKEQGYYRELGLDVSFQEAAEGKEPAQEVIQGRAEFGIGTSSLLILRSKGEPVVALAAIYQHSPYILLALQKSGIDNIHQIVGRRVSLEPHSDELVAYLKREGIQLTQLQLEPFRFEPMALLSGLVDVISAYSTDEPFLLQQKNIPYLEFSPRAGGIDFYGDTLFTTEAMIGQNPQLVRDFVKATQKGWVYALEHPQAMIDLIWKKYSQRHSKAHLAFEAAQSRKLIMGDVVEVGYMNPGRWRAIAEVYQDLGLLGENLDLQKFIYDPNPAPPWQWIYGILVTVGLLLATVSWVAWRFYRLQKSLYQENQERLLVEQELRAAEKRFRLLAEHTPFPVLISRLEDGKILYANPRALAQFAMSLDSMLESVALSFYVNLDDRKSLQAEIIQKGYIHNQELQLKKATAETFWACASATLIQFDDVKAILIAFWDVTEQYELRKHLAELAITDELTGAYNRRYFFQQGEVEFYRAQRYQSPLSLLMLDIDHFKEVNDKFGHDIGDRALQHFARLLQSTLRESDYLSRLGGEEFAILLPQIDLPGATQLAQRICQLVAQSPLEVQGRQIKLTTSVGVNSRQGQPDTLAQMIRDADQALYRAKSLGRNQAVVAAHLQY
jgi:diguanylate cyclase (GGDEF)-like protein/PAS domain S-box-containing protein